jgi:hypothetical protein
MLDEKSSSISTMRVWAWPFWIGIEWGEPLSRHFHRVWLCQIVISSVSSKQRWCGQYSRMNRSFRMVSWGFSIGSHVISLNPSLGNEWRDWTFASKGAETMLNERNRLNIAWDSSLFPTFWCYIITEHPVSEMVKAGESQLFIGNRMTCAQDRVLHRFQSYPERKIRQSGSVEF